MWSVWGIPMLPMLYIFPMKNGEPFQAEAAACPGECAICDLEKFHQGYTPPLGVSRERLQTDYDVGTSRNSTCGNHRILDNNADESCCVGGPLAVYTMPPVGGFSYL